MAPSNDMNHVIEAVARDFPEGNANVYEPAEAAALRLRDASFSAFIGEVQRLAGTFSENMSADVAGVGRDTWSEDAPTIYEIAGRLIPRWHFAMLNDAERNDAFADAIGRTVRPGDHVLDIGAGTGLLAMMAVRAGAGMVTSCEANPLLAEIARQVIATNGMSDRITVVAKHSTKLRVGIDMPSPADVLISEIVDCGLVGEGLFPTVRHARDRLLAWGGRMLPRAGRVFGQLISSQAAVELNRVSRASGFDVSLLNIVATPGHFPIRLYSWPHQVVSDASELLACDLGADALGDRGYRLVEVRANCSGTADALIVWFDLDLGHGIHVSNSPDNIKSHWMQGIIFLGSPVTITAGEKVTLCISWCDGKLGAEKV